MRHQKGAHARHRDGVVVRRDEVEANRRHGARHADHHVMAIAPDQAEVME
jgi:hypothetical protein